MSQGKTYIVNRSYMMYTWFSVAPFLGSAGPLPTELTICHLYCMPRIRNYIATHRDNRCARSMVI